MAAIRYNAQVPAHYGLHLFAVMPNRFHPLLTPKVSLPNPTKFLKVITAERANAVLARTGRSFRQEETDGREVRQERKFERIRFYIESNPVRARLGSPLCAVAQQGIACDQCFRPNSCQ